MRAQGCLNPGLTSTKPLNSERDSMAIEHFQCFISVFAKPRVVSTLGSDYPTPSADLREHLTISAYPKYVALLYLLLHIDSYISTLAHKTIRTLSQPAFLRTGS